MHLTLHMACHVSVAIFYVLIHLAVKPAAADELLLNDGSRLLGKVVKKENGTLEFETGYAGVIKVNWDSVSELRTDEPVKVLLEDETRLTADAIRKTSQATELEAEPDAPARSVTPGAVAYINPDPWRTGEGVKWTGIVNLDLEIDRGNTHEDDFEMDGVTKIRRQHDRITFSGQYDKEKTDGSVTKEEWKQGSKYDYFVSTKLYTGALLAFEHDKFSDLDLRTRVGPHVGYQFFESKELNLDTNMGLLYVHENYNVADNNNYWSLGWQVDFDWFLVPDRVQFYHTHTGFQSVKDKDNLTIDSWTGFRFPIYRGIVASTEAEVDYDGGAPSDVDRTDTTYRVKLGYQW